MSTKTIRARCGDRYFNFDVPSDVRQVIWGTTENGVEQFWKILVEDGVVTEVLPVEKNQVLAEALNAGTTKINSKFRN